jgi:DNA-binding NarL/FixJ family response regulator
MSSFLIVDDSHGKILFLRAMLKRAGWKGVIFEAMTTEEAKALIDAHPDIAGAFIDYYIPSENGPAVIAYLKAKNPQAHIALVSSGDNKKNAEEAKRAGAEEVICTSYQSDIVEDQLLDILVGWLF